MVKDLSTLIVEDEKQASDFLFTTLKDSPLRLKLLDVCSTVKQTIESININRPELVLMDVELVDGDAFEILDNVSNIEFELIFITGHSEFMARSLEYFAFSFVLKPFTGEEILRVISKFLEKREKLFNFYKLNMFKDFILDNSTKFLLHLGIEHRLIDLENVIYCKADGNYTIFLMSSGDKLIASKTLKYYDRLLFAKGFIRINRFILLNKLKIVSIYKKETILLSDGSKIQINNRQRQSLSDLIKSFNSK